MNVCVGSLFLVTDSHPNLYTVCYGPIRPQNWDGKERKIRIIRDSCGPDKHVIAKTNPILVLVL